MKDIPVFVVGADVTALGTLRSLKQHNINVFLDCSEEDVTRSSRWYQHSPFLDDSRSKINFEFLYQLPYPKIVLIPCSDHFVIELARMPEKYRDKLLTASCPESTLNILTDKVLFSKQLVASGVSAPATRVIESLADLEQLEESDFVDAFFKPSDSQIFERRFSVKGVRVDSKADAIAKFKRHRSEDYILVLQKYIPGPASNHYFIDGYRDAKGNITSLFARRRLRIHPVDFGNSCFMRSVPMESVKNAKADIISLLESIDYHGIFSAEFKYHESEDAMKLIEVNARAWWYVAFAASCGINTPYQAYCDTTGLPIQPVEHYPENVACAYPYRDFKSLRQSPDSPVNLLQMLISWIGAKQPIFCWADPMPAINISLKIFKGFIQKKFSSEPKRP